MHGLMEAGGWRGWGQLLDFCKGRSFNGNNLQSHFPFQKQFHLCCTSSLGALELAHNLSQKVCAKRVSGNMWQQIPCEAG